MLQPVCVHDKSALIERGPQPCGLERGAGRVPAVCV